MPLFQILTNCVRFSGQDICAIKWAKDKFDFFVDVISRYTCNPVIKNENTGSFDKSFYIILNLAVGRSFGGPELDDKVLA
jgi:hypothetical protein